LVLHYDGVGTGTDWLGKVGSIGVSNSSVSLPDRILLDGACNVRDIGGYRTATGGQVRRGLVYRADSLHRLTEEDVQILRGLQITTVVDLRRDDEVERFGRGPVTSWADVVLHAPLRHEATERSAPVAPRVLGAVSLGNLYRAYATHAARELAIIFGLLANGNALPVLVHCFAGKDRTGVVAALVLSVLGVDDDTVAFDYALSELVRERFFALAGAELAAAFPDEHQLDPRAAVFEAYAHTMTSFLDWIFQCYGSPEEYLLHIGVSPEEIDLLRARLVDPAPEQIHPERTPVAGGCAAPSTPQELLPSIEGGTAAG